MKRSHSESSTSDDDSEISTWSATQRRVLTSVVDKGKSVLVTGAGGVGKSEITKEITKRMLAKGHKVAIVAHTGIAALTIKGQTIWSFMHFNKERLQKTKEEIAGEFLAKHKQWCSEYQSYRTLIIDEISMVDPGIFETMDHIFQMTRRDYRPFGGLQLVLVGDFFQLPPPEMKKFGTRKYVFQSDIFWKTIEEMHDLKEMWRQNDPTFVSLLHRARKALQTSEDLQLLNSRVNAKLECEDRGIMPTILFSHNANVDEKNSTELQKLDTESKTFHVRCGQYARKFGPKDQGDIGVLKLLRTMNLLSSAFSDKLDPQDIKHTELKIGAQVMLSYNLDAAAGLVNGSRGVVIAFSENDKDQNEDIFMKKTDEHILYPAMSLPVVRLVNGKVIEIPFVKTTLDNAYVWKIAVKLSWATSIHKSQSLTLDAVEADLSRCFDAGMAYVALSRVKSLENLRLTNKISNSAFQVDQDVLHFYSRPFGVLKSEWNAKKFVPKPPNDLEDIEVVDSETLDSEMLESETQMWG
jgi:ATP-dependent DNA helicase PIF1